MSRIIKVKTRSQTCMQIEDSKLTDFYKSTFLLQFFLYNLLIFILLYIHEM